MDNIAATFMDGVLTVTAPLLAKPEPKRIPAHPASGRAERKGFDRQGPGDTDQDQRPVSIRP
ncbi:MAG: hypothetical protein ACYDGR_01535 [Candidatus Dormibacteria bacterium]